MRHGSYPRVVSSDAVKDAPMTLTYRVDGMSCEHCRAAVSGEVGRSPACARSTSTSTPSSCASTGHGRRRRAPWWPRSTRPATTPCRRERAAQARRLRRAARARLRRRDGRGRRDRPRPRGRRRADDAAHGEGAATRRRPRPRRRRRRRATGRRRRPSPTAARPRGHAGDAADPVRGLAVSDGGLTLDLARTELPRGARARCASRSATRPRAPCATSRSSTSGACT